MVEFSDNSQAENFIKELVLTIMIHHLETDGNKGCYAKSISNNLVGWISNQNVLSHSSGH